MKNQATKSDVFLLAILVIFLYWMNDRKFQEIKSKIDPIGEHIRFVDSSHFDWCGFEPNNKYKPYYP
jgi:hypothetical protein